jgi:uncharacterized protein YndB with AHSA1/START domain
MADEVLSRLTHAFTAAARIMERIFTISIDIAAPPERVWEVMRDVEHWHEWTPSVTRIKRSGSGPLAVGSRLIIFQPKFPPAMWLVTAVDPDRGFTSTSGFPFLRVVANHRVDKTAAGSRATLTLSYDGILGHLLARMTGDITERYLGYEARGLKARSENAAYRYPAEG